MADIIVTVSVEGGDIDILDMIKDELRGKKLRVKKSPGACGPCQGNDDPEQVPFSGCNSARGRRGNGCKCTVEVVEDRRR